ncbi:MAG: hypothetical protein WBQ94_04325 [Terracidiphilus sp.]
MTAIDPDLPRYQCHKIVRALLIFDVSVGANGGALLFPHDPRYAPIAVTAEWMKKHNPQPESAGQQTRGYFVRYEDGYESWSPEKAFVDGYTLIAEN